MLNVLRLIVLVAALVMVGTGAVMNFQFLSSQAHGEINIWTLGLASLAVDAMKAALVPLVAHAWSLRKFGYAAIGSVIIAGLVTLSVTSAIGFVDEMRGGVAAERSGVQASLKAKEAELAQVTEQRALLSVQRPVQVIEAEIRTAHADARWNATRRCRAINDTAARSFCTNLQDRERELVTSKEFERLATRADALRSNIARLVGKGADRAADRQAGLLSWLVGLSPEQLSNLITVLIASVLELAGSFGVYAAAASALQEREKLEEDRAVEQINAALSKSMEEEAARMGKPKSESGVSQTKAVQGEDAGAAEDQRSIRPRRARSAADRKGDRENMSADGQLS